jgi:hypothetical protein
MDTISQVRDIDEMDFYDRLLTKTHCGWNVLLVYL